MCVFPRCCRQRRLFFCVVDHSTEKLSALLPTTWTNDRRCWKQRRKTFEFDYLHEFETISEFTLGCQSEVLADVFHEEKLRWKISWDCPFNDHVQWTWTLTWTWTGNSILLSWIFWHAHRHGHERRHGHSQQHGHAYFDMPRAIHMYRNGIFRHCSNMCHNGVHPCSIVHKGIRQISDRGQNWVWHSRSSCQKP